jgi:hypothetical protein
MGGESVYAVRMRLRSLLWLVAMAAFLLPSFVGPAAASDRVEHPVAGECGHDAPPPPCPEKNTAKHAAGLCCPLMTCVMALLPSAARVGDRLPSGALDAVAVPHLIGLSPHQDPPPPRV